MCLIEMTGHGSNDWAAREMDPDARVSNRTMANNSQPDNDCDSSRQIADDYPPPADGPTVKTYQAIDGVVLREPGNQATTVQAAFDDVLNLGDMR